jgi:hypothetical protein
MSIQTGDFLFMEEGTEDFKRGLTGKKNGSGRAKLVASASSDDSRFDSFQNSPIISRPAVGIFILLVIAACFSLFAFILSCTAINEVRKVSYSVRNIRGDLKSLKQDVMSVDVKVDVSICPHGDVLYGEAPLSFGNKYYQIVGAPESSITWHQALQDARSRCFNSQRGTLVNVMSKEEDDFIFDELQRISGKFEDMGAWIGGADVGDEGTFSWLGVDDSWTPFWTDLTPIDGSYSNWAPGEPNQGGILDGEEDCITKYGGGVGRWNDKNWFVQNIIKRYIYRASYY